MINTDSRALRKQIRKKDAEIARLRRELLSAKRETDKVFHPWEAAKLVGEASGYVDFIKKAVFSSDGKSPIRRIASVVGKFSGISRTARTVFRIVAFLRTGAAAVLTVGIFAVLLPAAAIFFGTASIFFAVSSFASYRRVKKMTGCVYIAAYNVRSRVCAFTEKELYRRGAIVFLTPFLPGGMRTDGGRLCVGIRYFFKMKKILEKNGVSIYFIE